MADTISSELPAWLIPRTGDQSTAQILQTGIQNVIQNQQQARHFELQKQVFLAKQQAEQHQLDGAMALAGVMQKATAEGKWDDPKSEAEMWGVIRRYPWLKDNEAFKGALANFAEARRARRESENILLKSAIEKTPADVTKAEYVNDFNRKAAAAEASGDMEAAADYRKKATLVEGTMLGQKETIETYTDENGQTRFRITRGGEPSPIAPTQPFKTKLQESLHSYDNSMALLSHAEANMNATDFGIRGMAKDLMTKIGPQFGLKVNPSDVDVRNTLKLLRQDLYKSIRSDSNITKAEQEQIAGMLPQVEMFDVVESLPDAMGKLMTVQRVLKDKARTAAARLGVPPPPWTMTGSEIRDQIGKTLTFDQAKELIQKYNIPLQ